MPSADAVVVGAGLAGLSATLALAEAGARVHLLAKGHASTHWASGGLDVAALPRAVTVREAVARLADDARHPYAILSDALPPALEWIRGMLQHEGLPYVGTIDGPVVPVPTSIGATRPAAILPAAQAAALRPWEPGERLVVCGPGGFKDYWPHAIARGLRRAGAWWGSAGPERVDPLVVELPGVRDRLNLDAIELARLFEEPGWRWDAFAAIRRALIIGGLDGPGRMALPAVLGLDDHAAVLAEATSELPLEPFEVPLTPPSVPGLRLYRALRAAIVRAGGRVQIGQAVVRIGVRDGRIVEVAMEAAARQFVVRTDMLIMATGGIAGGGLVGHPDGTLREPLLDLPVEAPPAMSWLAREPLAAGGHPLEAAGIRSDAELRPVDASGRPAGPAGVRICGSLLAGQRYLRERCGDGVAVASGWLAAGAHRPSAPRRDAPQSLAGEVAG